MSERKITPERQIMDALGVRPGSPHSVNVRKEINKSKKGETVEMAASRVRATIAYKNWAIMNEKLRRKAPVKSDLAMQNERSGVLYTRLGVTKGSANWKEVRAAIRILVLQGQSDEDVMINILETPAWIRRIELHEAAERARERLRLQRIADRKAKGERIARLPRDQRMKAWGMLTFKIADHLKGTILHTHLAKQAEWFVSMERFARRAQGTWQENQTRLQAARVFEATRQRHRDEEQARREKQRDARLMSLEQEISLEDAQLYVRTTVPDYRLEEFRRWFRREYEGDTSCLVAGVNEFMGIGGDLSPPATDVVLPVVPEVVQQPAEPVTVEVTAPRKREGSLTTIRTRPDQSSFAKAVKHNCFDVCVVTGSQIHSRCSAAHLVEHKDGGADYYTNGLWLRWDIHKMMDDGECAIDPETMTMHFLPYVLEADPDLRAYEGKTLSATRKPINPEFLQGRWRAFQTYLS